MRIGEVARLAGISNRAVRHYHDIGVLPEPMRRANGYREYSVLDVTRLLRIRHLISLGLSLDKVANLLEPVGGSLDGELAALEEALRQQIAVLNDQLDAVVEARTSVVPEAPGRYGDLDERIRSMLGENAVRRFEADVSLLVSAADPAMHKRLSGTMNDIAANPGLAHRLAEVTTALLAVSAETTVAERDRIAGELREIMNDSGLPWEFGSASDPLVAEYRATALTQEQLDVLARVSR